MTPLSFFTKLYSHLHNYPGIPFWVLTPARRIVRNAANNILPKFLARDSVSMDRAEKDVIVSFTSFPSRIGNVWQVVECMLRQTYKPSKILLWLSRDQFPTEESVPMNLRERQGDVFEIRYVDGDIRSHKKYYYASKEYPDNLVFLIDDDIYYRPDIIESSVKEWTRIGGKAVVCNYAFEIACDKSGKRLSYTRWKKINRRSDSDNLFFGTGGGTLFRPSDLYEDLTDISLAQKLTPTADDIWVNAMARLAGLKIYADSRTMILPVVNRNDVTLCSVNYDEGQNDVQLSAIEDHYGPIFDI